MSDKELTRIIELIETINLHSNDWDADDVEDFSNMEIAWSGCDNTIGINKVHPYLKQLKAYKEKYGEE